MTPTRALPLLMGLLLLPMGCGGNDDPTGPNELSCNPASAIVTFPDANLEAAIRDALSVGAQVELTCGLVSGLTALGADGAGITSLVGIQNLTGLTVLALRNNSITDISALSGLTSLTSLSLDGNSITDPSVLSGLTALTRLGLAANSITDISVLSGLTSLMVLILDNNSITDISVLSGLTSLTLLSLAANSIFDISALSGLTRLTSLHLIANRSLNNIQPLLNNTGLGTGDTVDLRVTAVSCTDVAALQAKGVTVCSDCP